MTFHLLFALLGVVGGVWALYYGGNEFVRGASLLATRLRVSPLAVGLTVVAMGTSAPEFFVSFLAALQGHPSIAVGNVVGSNVANVLLILGVASLLAPVMKEAQLFTFDFPWLFFSYLLVFIGVIVYYPSSYGAFARWAGGLLLLSLAAYLTLLYRKSKKEQRLQEELLKAEGLVEDVHERTVSLSRIVVRLFLGLSFLLLGSEALIRGSTWLAREVLHVSERFISLTVIAIGTSLPELVTSIVASTKDENEISLGNIVGSNIFNVMGVLGVSAVLSPLHVSLPEFWYDYGMMCLSSALLVVLLKRRGRVGRPAGAGFLLLYTGYIVLLYFTRFQ
ncbi:Na+/Ca+ antiporter, CaCA family [Spirochaeta thermophila DSM 6578]|uniref:Na+/Ca+ antiporter, CaCA family n=1 Tax=Winmispira thermophila (strain ATCC 700085 / DSM 6578 / Z-1203) TaxID=869211 RepID=G0GDL7_WINT7|nr:calcium/sodium antiporter [Spirochaeta thermophila]AEJ61364.1 Na+/Ca+ antiporter, CaCA family [Spirochaeta thermophila DSM 6578]